MYVVGNYTSDIYSRNMLCIFSIICVKWAGSVIDGRYMFILQSALVRSGLGHHL